MTERCKNEDYTLAVGSSAPLCLCDDICKLDKSAIIMTDTRRNRDTFDRYDDLPAEIQKHLSELEMLIGDLDGKTLCTEMNGEGDERFFSDEGTIVADDYVEHFNGIAAGIRAMTPTISRPDTGLTKGSAMNAMAPVPKDAPLMIAWEAYKETDDYKNSHSWATRFIPDDDPAEVERVRASGANYFGKEQRIMAVEGSLWAAFMNGYQGQAMTNTDDVKAMEKRYARHGEHLFNAAKSLGWKDDGESPFNFIVRHATSLSAQAQGSGTERGSLVDHLCEHWLQSIVCNHEAKTDRAVCWCGWTSDEQPNVGSAVRAWVDHSLPRSLAETIIPSSENMDARFEWLQSKAADMGYVLTPEPEHTDSPHAHPSAGPAVRELADAMAARSSGWASRADTIINGAIMAEEILHWAIKVRALSGPSGPSVEDDVQRRRAEGNPITEQQPHAPSDAQKCEKCNGAGWLWWNELDDYDGPAISTGRDDTKYSCDDRSHNAAIRSLTQTGEK